MDKQFVTEEMYYWENALCSYLDESVGSSVFLALILMLSGFSGSTIAHFFFSPLSGCDHLETDMFINKLAMMRSGFRVGRRTDGESKQKSCLEKLA